MERDQETKLIAANIFVRYLGKFFIHMSVEQIIRVFPKNYGNFNSWCTFT